MKYLLHIVYKRNIIILQDLKFLTLCDIHKFDIFYLENIKTKFRMS